MFNEGLFIDENYELLIYHDVSLIPEMIYDNVVIDYSTECWNWIRRLPHDGYPEWIVKRGNGTASWVRMHRYSYMCFNGPIPEGYLVRHLCHNKRCCNPNHLMIGTAKDNWLDSEVKQRELLRDNPYFKESKEVKVGNLVYPSGKTMRKSLGLSYSSVKKYTTNGVFDHVGYLNSLERLGKPLNQKVLNVIRELDNEK